MTIAKWLEEKHSGPEGEVEDELIKPWHRNTYINRRDYSVWDALSDNIGVDVNTTSTGALDQEKNGASSDNFRTDIWWFYNVFNKKISLTWRYSLISHIQSAGLLTTALQEHFFSVGERSFPWEFPTFKTFYMHKNLYKTLRERKRKKTYMSTSTVCNLIRLFSTSVTGVRMSRMSILTS